MTLSLKNTSQKLIGLSVFAIGFLVLKYANLTVQGVKNGITLCLETVIPSLFIFTVIAEFVDSKRVWGLTEYGWISLETEYVTRVAS